MYVETNMLIYSLFDNTAIVFPPKIEEPKRQSKKVKQEEGDEKKKNEPTMTLNKFGGIDKNEGVQKLCFGELDGKRHVSFGISGYRHCYFGTTFGQRNS